MVFGSYNKGIVPHRTAFDWISRDEAVVDTYRSEPKTSFDFTLNGYYNLFYSMLWLKKEEHLRQDAKGSARAVCLRDGGPGGQLRQRRGSGGRELPGPTA